jgi:hypothetical protein
VVDRGSGAKDVPARLTWGAARPFPLPRRRQRKIPAPWPQSLDFFRTPLVIEPSAGQLSSDAGLLPLRHFDERIGLTRAFADTLDDPRHRDHKKACVQDYLKEYGKRKVEANALVTRPDQARALCLAAIRKYVSLSGVERHRKWLAREQEKVKNALPATLRAAAGE